MIKANAVVARLSHLGTLPDSVIKLSGMINDDRSGAADFERVIKPDPALTTNLLKLVNSAAFSLPRKVESVRQAVAYLGTKRLFEVATTAGFAQVIPAKLPGYGLDAPGFWIHSVAVAVISERLAKELGLAAPDLVFTAGLLHDVGKLAIGSFLAGAEKQVRDSLDDGEITFVAAERQALGIDHGEVGALLAEKWRLPERVGWSARWHHRPGAAAAAGADQTLVDLVHAADGLAHALGFGVDMGELSRTVEEETIERLGLRVQDLEHVASETLHVIREMGELLGSVPRRSGGRA